MNRDTFLFAGIALIVLVLCICIAIGPRAPRSRDEIEAEMYRDLVELTARGFDVTIDNSGPAPSLVTGPAHAGGRK